MSSSRKVDYASGPFVFDPREVPAALRAERTQLQLFDHEQKKAAFGKVFDPAEDVARQEFKQEADVLYQLRRHGAMQAFQRPGQSGVQDFTVDYQEAIHAVRDAEAAYARLDPEIRKKYRSWAHLGAAVQDGSFKAPEGPAGGSGGPAGASPSDSAAEKAPKGA